MRTNYTKGYCAIHSHKCYPKKGYIEVRYMWWHENNPWLTQHNTTKIDYESFVHRINNPETIKDIISDREHCFYNNAFKLIDLHLIPVKEI